MLFKRIGNSMSTHLGVDVILGGSIKHNHALFCSTVRQGSKGDSLVASHKNSSIRKKICCLLICCWIHITILIHPTNNNMPKQNLHIFHPDVWHTQAYIYLAITILIVTMMMKYALAPVARPHRE